jgi:RNA polymerase sigma-70 factor (ECF subfamily)
MKSRSEPSSTSTSPAWSASLARYTRRRSDAEDIAQETWWKVWRKLDMFREGASSTAWLYRVTINCASDWVELRRQPSSHRHRGIRTPPRRRRCDLPLAGMAKAEFAQAVRDAIAELPEPFRSSIVLREIEGLSYEKIFRSRTSRSAPSNPASSAHARD